MNDMIPAPGAGHVLGLGLVLVLQRILRLRIAAWEVDRDSVGAVAQLPAAARLFPQAQASQNCPCMHDRGHYPLIPRNAATGEETPEMEKLYHGFGAFTIAAKNMIYEILALSILFYILMKKEKMANFRITIAFEWQTSSTVVKGTQFSNCGVGSQMKGANPT
jgi:hypothetical protein